MPTALKKLLRPPYDLFLLGQGLLQYALLNKNTTVAYLAMIRVFCRTRGASSEFLSRVVSWFSPQLDLKNPKGVLGLISDEKMSEIQKALDEKGYYVAHQALSSQDCDELLNFALTHKGVNRRTEKQDPNTWKEVKSLFRRDSPESPRFDYPSTALVESPLVQRLFCDPSILAIASRYLKTTPILDIVTMWWHTSFSKEPDSEAAQYFHFDMDRLKWIKFFFYVTDVGPENGPHVFVEGSHRVGGIPDELLSFGYNRLTDDQVAQHYPKEKMITFAAKRGTIIIEDTKGLHKGQHVKQGDRLLFQLEYTNCLFGTPGPHLMIPQLKTPEFQATWRANPAIFKLFKDKSTSEKGTGSRDDKPRPATQTWDAKEATTAALPQN